MTLFMDATKMWRKTLSRTIIWPHNFFSGAFCYTLFGIKAQFIIRKEEKKNQKCLPVGQGTMRKC